MPNGHMSVEIFSPKIHRRNSPHDFLPNGVACGKFLDAAEISSGVIFSRITFF
ncbi:hypothetical protein FUAX_06420 [Fulvitalea axinellae]|uniref:Uncharacterized protein n=1 Tax=Fulvitalea axinellae TaxID=1182444 RepID=A0AAU9CG79_9BACT|nr:hypothetical protein FUAX_06420 [Fulvitalea axinellae]